MPALENPKHERFSQELAKGKSQADAYAEAGYKPSEPHASRLARNGKVIARVAELLERRAAKTDITVVGLTARLLRLADLAEQAGITYDDETGELKAASSKHLSIARNALMDIGKLNGLVVDKSINAAVSVEELLDRL